MNYIRHLNAFFSFVRSDNRLTSSHVSLYFALFQYWNFHRFQNPFPIYRDNLMQISKIGSKNTYHKCLKELHQARYIVYHPSASKFLPVKISMMRLDLKEEGGKFQQLDLFTPGTHNQPPPLPSEKGSEARVPILTDACPKIETDRVPNLTAASTDFDTGTVPNLGHTIKPNNKQINSVLNTPTQIFEKNKKLSEKINELARVPNLRHGHPKPAGGRPESVEGPTLPQVEEFFSQQNYPQKEAQKFFYYNQGKSWMLNETLPITDWQSLAHKWMLNSKTSNKETTMDLDTAIQYLYERYLQGEKINKLLLPQYADHLQLELTDKTKQEAIQRRINQLSGSNEYSQNQLWQAYMNEQWNDALVIKDAPNLLALVKRLAVLKHFQKLKAKGWTKII